MSPPLCALMSFITRAWISSAQADSWSASASICSTVASPFCSVPMTHLRSMLVAAEAVVDQGQVAYISLQDYPDFGLREIGQIFANRSPDNPAGLDTRPGPD